MINRCRVASVAISVTLLLAPSLALAAFDVDLRYGARGSAVIELQQFLIARGLLSADSATGYFGSLTLAAVKTFQAQQNISPVGGFFGPLTRAAANTLAGRVIPPSASPAVAAQIAALLERVQQLRAQIAALTNAPVTPTSGSSSAATSISGNASSTSDDNSTGTLSASPASGAAPLTVSLVFSVSTPGSYSLDFGDGSNLLTFDLRQSMPSLPVMHIYNSNKSPGPFLATLKNSSGRTLASTAITVSGAFLSITADNYVGTRMVSSGTSATIRWLASSVMTGSCSITGDGNPTGWPSTESNPGYPMAGLSTGPITSAHTWTLACTALDGSPAVASVTVSPAQ